MIYSFCQTKQFYDSKIVTLPVFLPIEKLFDDMDVLYSKKQKQLQYIRRLQFRNEHALSK